MRFYIVQIEYVTEPDPDANENDPLPKQKTLVVYQYRGKVSDLGLENILAEDMRKNIGDMKKHQDFISLVAEITEPNTLRVLKLWNQRCIDFDSQLFHEGTIDERDSSPRRHDEDREDFPDS